MKVAIIGAGPAGIYAADILHKSVTDAAVTIDIFEQLPAPYGLVRYGVAPDHPRIKAIIKALREVLDSGTVRFFGNVCYGQDITLADLREHYHAVIFATGAVKDAALDIPGIDAAYSFGAAAFVSWFDGHPDVPRYWPLDARSVAVIGNGNVALDISRVLIKHVADMLSTEIPDNVREVFAQNPIETLHIFGRKGPLQVKFTPLELRELGEVAGVDMVLDPQDFAQTDEHIENLKNTNKQILVISRIFSKWLAEQAARESAAPRQLVFHFWAKPVAVLKDEQGRVCALKIQRTKPDGSGGVIDTDVFETVPVQALYRAVGYFGSAVAGVPFDSARGVIPNTAGRVQSNTGEIMPGVYATGWIKRGPVGLIGATKSDARETLECLVVDWQRGKLWHHTADAGDPPQITSLLRERGVEYTDIEGWHRLDAAEQELGMKNQRERIKIVPRGQMVQISRAGRS
ncbi:FAD-dependent oxidoreductase [Canibacter sp. lx-72]|nr:FAD-dependent oxidoreductase [Canibacter zhuwentaonis]MBT1018631.1 FAD-dependent oxidoreductase [Canibacter zhuwentaonis]MBT1035859.1 FAD-dependent oxidoreductase [Canibacter zhuwentaonis]